jgi:hypothetical protein
MRVVAVVEIAVLAALAQPQERRTAQPGSRALAVYMRAQLPEPAQSRLAS